MYSCICPCGNSCCHLGAVSLLRTIQVTYWRTTLGGPREWFNTSNHSRCACILCNLVGNKFCSPPLPWTPGISAGKLRDIRCLSRVIRVTKHGTAKGTPSGLCVHTLQVRSACIMTWTHILHLQQVCVANLLRLIRCCCSHKQLLLRLLQALSR